MAVSVSAVGGGWGVGDTAVGVGVSSGWGTAVDAGSVVGPAVVAGVGVDVGWG